MQLLYVLGLVKVIRRDEQGRILECNNLTIINLVLSRFGPMTERNTTRAVLLIQVVCSLLAFFIRYKLVQYVY